MTTSTADTYFIQARAALLRVCLGCILCSLIFKMHGAHAAQSEIDLLAPGLDLVSVKFTYGETERLPAYYGKKTESRFDTKVGFIGAADSATRGLGLFKTSRLPGFIEENVSLWVAKIKWHLNSVDARASLSPQLRIESKDTVIEIKQVDRSYWMVWHKTLD
jgi:hypothetical protein